MKISVIIPVLNGAHLLERAVASAKGASEVIVVDGGSADGSAGAAMRLGATLMRTGPNRGLQMDAGAYAATGDVLLFLHADTALPEGWRAFVEEAMKDKGNAGGAFGLSIDSKRPAYRIIELVVRLRSRVFGLVYGDQAIFVRREAFLRAGGFNKLPLMEDVDCVKRLRPFGRMASLAASVSTSAGRWEEKGILRNTLGNWLILALYLSGVSPERLYRLYYRGA